MSKIKIRSLEVGKGEISRIGGPRTPMVTSSAGAGLLASGMYALVAATNSEQDYLWDYVWRVPPVIAVSFMMLLIGTSMIQAVSVSASYASAATRIRQWKRYREENPGPRKVLFGLRQDVPRLLLIAVVYSAVLVIVTGQCGPWIRMFFERYM